MATDPNIEQVRILNSDNNTSYYLYVRVDRLKQFIEFLTANRPPELQSSMPGLSWSAMLGLDAIFAQRPRKFPVNDILSWLREQVALPLSNAQIENTLERFSVLYPPDAAATTENA